ncbi:MAG: DUF3786 domain-containing protein [Xanthomonadaceae bacterium]|nr:DUF3786 domain-containing protein [Xanthomonadaceae bacterium]
MQKQKNYQRTFALAAEKFRNTDISYLDTHPEISYNKQDGIIALPFFQRPYTISYPELAFSCPQEPVISLVSKIIILHYLINANHSTRTGELTNYGGIPGGSFYFPVFKRKTTDILLAKLGNNGEALKRAGEILGATTSSLGDVSFTIRALPDIDLTLIFWEGDEDFPSAYDILFDAAIDRYLSLEDIVVLAQMVTKRVLSRTMAGSTIERKETKPDQDAE